MSKYLTKEHLLDLDGSEWIDIGNKNIAENLHMIALKDKYLLVKREGKCDSTKCGSICCKFIELGSREYSKGFSNVTNEFGSNILNKRCGNLDKCGKCKLWKKKGFPIACVQFPHPTDKTYMHIMDRCTFKFKILFEMDRPKILQTRKEMIKCFEEQTE